MLLECGRRKEPLGAVESPGGELEVTAVLDEPVTLFEGQDFIVPEPCEPLARIGGCTDLDSVPEADVVDDVDARGWQPFVEDVPDAPFACSAYPGGGIPHADPRSTCPAGSRHRVGGTHLVVHPLGDKGQVG